VEAATAPMRVHYVHSVHYVHFRSFAASPYRQADAPLTLPRSSSYNVLADLNRIGYQKSIMHPPVAIIVVLLCAPFCLRRIEFSPGHIVSRYFNSVPFRKKK
jgi:hypothetical protein